MMRGAVAAQQQARCQEPSWCDVLRVGHQAVYGLELCAPEGQSATSSDGQRYTKVIYIGASNDQTVQRRVLASRVENATVRQCREAKWQTRVLFLDCGCPLGTEDLATLVLGGVSAALAGSKYSRARTCFERLYENSALGGCLKCGYRATANKRVVFWKRCECLGQGLPPEDEADQKAARVDALTTQVALLQQQLAAALRAGRREQPGDEPRVPGIGGASAVGREPSAARELDAARVSVLPAASFGPTQLASAAAPARAGMRDVLTRPAGADLPARPLKRPASANSQRGPLKRPAAPQPTWRREASVPVVLIQGELYAHLEWFFGKPTSGSQRKTVRAKCSLKSDAVCLHGGDAKTLLGSDGFVGTPDAPPKDLLPEGVALTTKAVPTRCLARPSRRSAGFVKASRPRTGKKAKMVWRLAALDAAGVGRAV